MSLPEETVILPVTLTQSAANAVREIITEKNLQGYALRLFISGGGCSGYQYGLGLDNRIKSEDIVVETEGIKLVVDSALTDYVQGITVDYVQETDATGFKIINPNPIFSCSCGQEGSSCGSDDSSGCASCG